MHAQLGRRLLVHEPVPTDNVREPRQLHNTMLNENQPGPFARPARASVSVSVCHHRGLRKLPLILPGFFLPA